MLIGNGVCRGDPARGGSPSRPKGALRWPFGYDKFGLPTQTPTCPSGSAVRTGIYLYEYRSRIYNATTELCYLLF